MDWLLTGIPAWITAVAAVATAAAASFAALQYWDSRKIKRGLDDYEWDVLKAVNEKSAGSGFSVSLNDLVHYMEWKAEEIVYNMHIGWVPTNMSLKFSVRYMAFCEVLVGRGYLLCMSKEKFHREYELSPEGVMFVISNLSKLKKRSYKGVFDDIVDRELKCREKVLNFHGEEHPVDADTAAVDLVYEFPPAEHDPQGNNPCDVLGMVMTEGNKSLIDARLGPLTIVSIGGAEQSLYLYRGRSSQKLQEEGKLACSVAYKHKKPDGLLDIWLCDDLAVMLYGENMSHEEMLRASEEKLLDKQNKIREVYYKLPPLKKVAYEPVAS